MKPPSKKELLELQRRYRSDRKIGEVLGGVPPYLVAYWRRKKGVPSYSSPKYSRTQIMEVWERFGNDVLAGDALGMTGNGFQYWRKKYGIIEKPARLKFEQLQIPLPGLDPYSSKRKKWNFLHKIICHNGGVTLIRSGENVLTEPDRVCLKDIENEAGRILEERGVRSIKNPHKIIGPYNSYTAGNGNNKALSILHDYASLSYPSNGGQIFDAISNGNILPGELVVSSDPGVMGVGAVGALGIHLERSGITDTLTAGKFQLSVFDVIRISLLDTPPNAVEPLDIILYLKSGGRAKEVEGKAIEFVGSTIECFELEKRFALCYLSEMLKCVAAGIVCNKNIEKLLRKKALIKFSIVNTDLGTHYTSSLHQSVLEIEPMLGVFRRGKLDIEPLCDHINTGINTIFAGYYSGGMYRSIYDIASIIGKRSISTSVKLFIQPATRDILLRIDEEGVYRQLVVSGCSMLPTSPVFIEFPSAVFRSVPGSVMITDPSVLPVIPPDYPHPVFLANHHIAAASALHGVITDPREL